MLHGTEKSQYLNDDEIILWHCVFESRDYGVKA